MDKSMMKRIVLNEYSIAKKEFEIAFLYLSDTYNYVPMDLHYDIRTAQSILTELAKTMQDLINIKNSGQPEKNKEEKENG